MGHIVLAEGVTTNPEKIDAIVKWPIPKRERKDVRSFLGITGYYRKYVKDYAKITNPLFALIGGKRGTRDPPSFWKDMCQLAFNTLQLTSAPILTYTRLFMVNTDACLDGLGAVLSQQQDGWERVVAYASRALSSPEKKYLSRKLEFKAMHWALTVKLALSMHSPTEWQKEPFKG